MWVRSGGRGHILNPALIKLNHQISGDRLNQKPPLFLYCSQYSNNEFFFGCFLITSLSIKIIPRLKTEDSAEKDEGKENSI